MIVEVSPIHRLGGRDKFRLYFFILTDTAFAFGGGLPFFHLSVEEEAWNGTPVPRGLHLPLSCQSFKILLLMVDPVVRAARHIDQVFQKAVGGV